MIKNFISKSLEFVELLICEKIAGFVFVLTKWDEKLQRYSNTKNAFRCQILVLLDYRFQFNIKVYSEGLMITNFISKSLECIKLLICEKIAGLFLFKRNQKKNCKSTLTPKMPFAARFSCCAMVVLTSPVKCVFPTLQVCTLWLVALFQQGSHHLMLSPLFVSYWDMMKCIFLHRFLLLCS